MDWEQAAATAHVASASSALLTGVTVVFLPKGTHTHRVIGTGYVLALVLVNAAALSLRRESVFGLFHWLAVASLVTLVVGLVPLILGKRSPRVIATHAFCMTWSYVGLAAAGCGQLAVAAGPDRAALAVPVAIGAVLSLGGVVIVKKVPPSLDRVLTASRASRQTA